MAMPKTIWKGETLYFLLLRDDEKMTDTYEKVADIVRKKWDLQLAKPLFFCIYCNVPLYPQNLHSRIADGTG